MHNHEFSQHDGSLLNSQLKEFIDRVIVPALVREYLAQSQELEVKQRNITEDRNSSLASASRVKRTSSTSNEKQLLTVAEVAAVLGIKDATVRAWICRRKITYVKLGRLVRIPAKHIKMLIERATIPSRM